MTVLFIFVGIGIAAWMGTARLARGQVLSLREQEFTLAARALGAGNMRTSSATCCPTCSARW